MVNGLLMDNHVTGHVEYLIQLLNLDDTFREIWLQLKCPLLRLDECGLQLSSPDDLIWDYCQREQVILVTANRNRTGSDSLGEAIASRNSPTCLPVLTLAKPARIETERTYALRTAAKLLQYVIDIESLRGVGRMYVPFSLQKLPHRAQSPSHVLSRLRF